MNTTVELKVSIDIEDVYNELSCADQEQFLVNHATDIAGDIGTVNVYVDFSIDSNETGENALKWYGASFLLFIVAFCLSVIYNTF